MVATEKYISLVFNLTSPPYLKRRRHNNPLKTLATKRNLPENPKTQQQPIFPLRVSNKFLARAAVAVFGLGFIDAGYSGDWKRIGVVSKESEDFLKAAAFVVIPLCVALILSISKEQES